MRFFNGANETSVEVLGIEVLEWVLINFEGLPSGGLLFDFSNDIFIHWVVMEG